MPSLRKKNTSHWLWIGALGLILLWIGDYLSYRSTRTQQQCKQWLPHIEAYHNAKGRYPYNLSELTEDSRSAEALWYRDYGCGYGTTRGEWFELYTPEADATASVYRSKTGAWQRVHLSSEPFMEEPFVEEPFVEEP